MSRNPKALGMRNAERRHDFQCTPIADYYRTPGARELAHGVKAGSERAIMQMGQEMAALLGPSDVLVPVPSRTGRATVTLAMANEIARLSGAVVADVLRGAERNASLYDLKKGGDDVSTVDFGYRVEGESPNSPVLIDTVLDTGATVRAALSLMPNARVVVHSSSNPDPEQSRRIQEACALFSMRGRAESAPQPNFVEDIPNESWLSEKIEYSKSRGVNAWGVPYMSTATGYFRGPVEVPLDVLLGLSGQRGEQSSVRQDSIDWLTENWPEVADYAPYIEVAYNGQAWVSEGSHRIMVAAQKGLQSLKVDVRFFDGGQRSIGPLRYLAVPEEVDGAKPGYRELMR